MQKLLHIDHPPYVVVRAAKNALRINWTKPEKKPCVVPEKSGDRSPMPAIDTTQLALSFENSNELKTADDNVKKLFTLAFQPQRDTLLFYQEQLIRLVRRHKFDDDSMEVRIARATASIRYMQAKYEKSPNDKKLFVIIKEKIDRRKKGLKELRKADYRRFEWLLEKLDLEYKPLPQTKFNIFRRDCLTRLASEHCDNFKQERLDEYKKVLQSQQVDFLADKLAKMQFIRSEQLELGADVTVSEDDIAEVQKQHDELKQKREEEMKGVDTTTKWKIF